MVELNTLFEMSTTNKSVFLLILVVSPILFIYFVVFVYLLFRLCCNNCSKKKTKSKKVQTNQDKADYITDTCEVFLGQPASDVIIKDHKRQTSLLRSPAQSALCDVIRSENLKMLKSSLRKTQSDVVNLNNADEVDNPVKVDLEEKIVIKDPKSRSSSEPYVSSVHNFTLKETNTLNSPTTTAKCYGADVTRVNIPCEVPGTRNCKSESSTSIVDKPFKEHIEKESSPSSSPFVEIDLGSV